jgi:hypothetical protein
MATVTGKLKDFENNALTAHPILQFTPTGPGIGDAIYADKTVRVRTFGQNGEFSVNLLPVIGLSGQVRYRMSVIYLDDQGVQVGYSEWPNPFSVPPEGGDLSTLAAVAVNSDTVAVGPDVTADTSDGIFAGFKANSSTGDLYMRRLKTNG